MPIKTFYIEKTDLYDLFIIQNLSRKDVAKKYGCSEVLIKKKCQEFNIKKSIKARSLNLKKRSIVICNYCNKSFEVRTFRATTDVEQWRAKYCSCKCSSAARYKGKFHKRSMRNKHAATRRARLKNQAPELTKEENMLLSIIYENCPNGFEVDHIIPLAKGGLHHPNNLQYLSMVENRKKGSKLV